MKALTFTGNTGQLPIDTKIVERGNMIHGASDGDEIISYFSIEGVNYAGHSGTCSLTKGTIGKAMPNGDYPVITGFIQGMPFNYAVYHEGQYYKVEWTGSYTKSGHTLWNGKLTDTVQIKDNPYWSLDPEWPEIDHEVQAYRAPLTGKSNLYLYFPIQRYMPKYYKPYSCKFSTIEASGRLTKPKDISRTAYTFTKTDLQRGYITLLLSCEPFVNSTSVDTERAIKLIW
jgi:hypothetical protein